MGLIVLAVAMLIGMGAAMVALAPGEYDEASLCPYETAPERVMVLVDRSDALIGPDRVRRLIEAAERQMPVHGRLSIHQLGPNAPGGGILGDALFDLCNPGRGEQVSPIYRNPRRVQELYETQFGAPLDRVLDEITRPLEAPTSPIVEAVAELLRSAQDGYGAGRVKLIVVSDFLQNTDAYGSAYRGGPPDPAPAATLISDARGAGPAEIEAVVMRRARLVERQQENRQAFWDPAFAEAGLPVIWR